MQTWQIFLGTIMGVLTLSLCVYISFTARQKGPILSNTFLWLSKEEQEKANKKAEYHLVTVIFSLLALFSFIDMIYILTLSNIFLYIGACVLTAAIIYAILDAMKTNH